MMAQVIPAVLTQTQLEREARDRQMEARFEKQRAELLELLTATQLKPEMKSKHYVKDLSLSDKEHHLDSKREQMSD